MATVTRDARIAHAKARPSRIPPKNRRVRGIDRAGHFSPDLTEPTHGYGPLWLVGHRDSRENLIAHSLTADLEEAKADAFAAGTVMTVNPAFNGTRFLVLDVDRPRNFRPTHFLDVPADSNTCWSSEYLPAETLPSRSAAVLVTEERNRARATDDGQWTIILELGEPIPLVVTKMFEMGRSGFGVEVSQGYRPIRLLRPEAHEFTRNGKLDA